MTVAAAVPGTFVRPELLEKALQRGEIGEFKAVSHFAACLMPLLAALNWRGNPRTLLEALPHFADSLDLVDLRNVLVALGYRSRPHKLSAADIDERLFPCLFVPKSGAPFVILEAGDREHRVFDAATGREEWRAKADVRGTAYFVEKVTYDDANPNHAKENWMRWVSLRFRSLFLRMLLVTALLNLLALAVPIYVMTVYDKVIGLRSVDVLMVLVIGVSIALICDAALRVIRAHALAYIGARITGLVGAATLRQILFMPPSQTEQAPISQQTTRIKEFESVREFFTGPLATVVLELPFVLFFVFVIAMLGGIVAWVPAVMVVLFVVTGLIMVPAMKRSANESSISRSNRQSFLVEMLRNLRTIKQHCAEDTWLERYRRQSAATAVNNFRAAQVAFLMQTAAQLIMTAAGIATLALGTLQVLEHEMTIGALIATMALVWRVLSPLQMGFVALSRWEQIKLGLTRVNAVMRLPAEREAFVESKSARKFAGAITFLRVSLRYRPDTEPALMGAEFVINPKEFVIITGASGAGKSTCLKTICGMYQPQAGCVIIDGLDIRQIDIVDLRQAVAYVPQRCELFHGTLAQNLRLVDPTASADKIRQACEMAGLMEDIDQLPEGIETRIGDNRLHQMPTGFLQRLALARAYVKDAPIMLLDEPGQSLDDRGDEKLMETLNKFKGRSTVVMVTHRPSHMRMADRLIVMEEGRIVASGSPDEVLGPPAGKKKA